MSLWGFLFTAQKFIHFFPSDKKILENNVSIKKKKKVNLILKNLISCSSILHKTAALNIPCIWPYTWVCDTPSIKKQTNLISRRVLK